MAEERIDAFQFRGSEQGKELIRENKKAEGEDNVDRSHPATDFELLAFVVSGYFVEGDIGGVTEGPESERHGMPQCHYTADDGPTHPFVFFGGPLQWFPVGWAPAGRVAKCKRHGRRGPQQKPLHTALTDHDSRPPHLQAG